MSGHKRTLISIDPTLYRQMHEKEMRERFLAGSPRMDRVGTARSDQKVLAGSSFDQVRNKKGFLNLALSLSDPFRLVDEERTNVTSREETGDTREDLLAQKSIRGKKQPGISQNNNKAHLSAGAGKEKPIPFSGFPASDEETYWEDADQYAENDKPEDEVINPIDPGLSRIEPDVSRGEELDITLSTLEDLLKEASGWQTCEAIDFIGEPTGVEIDVDEWTGGALNRFIASLLNLETQWKEANMRQEDLHNWIEIEYPNLRKQLEDITFQARMNVLQSQLRINAADRAAKALTTQGYKLQQAGYQGADLREAFACTLVHPDGSEVQVRVDPPPQPSGQQALHVFSMDAASRTRHELDRRSMEIRNALYRHGISSGNWVDEPADIHAGKNRRKEEETATFQDQESRSVSLQVYPLMEEYENRSQTQA